MWSACRCETTTASTSQYSRWRRSLPNTPQPQSSSTQLPPASTRYPLHAPPASCHAGDLPSTVMRTRATLYRVTVLAATGTGGFDTVLLVFGVLLMGGALLSGLARRSFLSLTALFVLAGFLLGSGGLGVLELDPQSGFVADLAIVALIVILFRDGLEVEAEMLQKAWHLPFRKLVLAMPLTAAIVALAARALTDLGWTECFLLGALLAPTDPVLSSSVVTNPRVPRIVRHSLNLESGMNDGLALPAVLAFTAVLVGAGAGGEEFVWWKFVLQDVTLGFAFGLVMGLLASVRCPASGASTAGSRTIRSRSTRSGRRSRPMASRSCRPRGTG